MACPLGQSDSLLGARHPGQWCRAEWSKGLEAQRSVQWWWQQQKQSHQIIPMVTLAILLAAWPPLTPVPFPATECLTFLVFLRVTYWFSNRFPFGQASQVDCYCLEPVIGVLVPCSCPWLWSPNVTSPLNTVSRDTFQIDFCIVLQISSSK